MITGSLVVGLGDVIAQFIEKTKNLIGKDGKHELVRVFHLWWHGPLLIQALENALGTSMKFKVGLKKTILDQTIMAPLNITIFSMVKIFFRLQLGTQKLYRSAF
jgi:hypothetical protein